MKRSSYPNINPKRADGIKPNGVPYRVMVVEDKEFHRKQIVQILESEKYDILGQATDGEEALSVFNKFAEKLDLVTTDLDMPRLDGYALLYQIKQRKPEIKVVFISDDTSKGVVHDLIKMGASDFILKPIDRGKILDRIKQVLQKGP